MTKNYEKNTLISVIIPVYNVRSYLKRCIESVLSQTHRHLEILLIDDGSDDGSELICEQYSKKDKRIKVFHKCNGGLSSARNYGLQHVTGEYIGFVDSDDYIDIKMYEHLVGVINDDIDLAACGVKEEYTKRYKRKYCASNFTCGCQMMNRFEAMRELLLLRAFGFSACNKLFKKTLFNDVRFPEGKSSEDIPVMYKIFSKINYAVNNGYTDYHYVHRPGSITGGNFFDRRMDFYYFTKEILEDISVNYPQYKNEAFTLHLKSVYSLMNQILNSRNKRKYKKTYKMLQDILAENEGSIKESSYIDENTRKDMLSKIKKGLDEETEEFCSKVQYNMLKDKVEKLSEFYNILIQWISLKEKGIAIGDFIKKGGYRTVAIYGMKELGELLYEEMKNSDICVEYVIDQSREFIFIDVPVLKPNEALFPVDIIIVTAVHYFEEIKELLKSKVNCPICSLEDILFFEDE